jgi:uncharacterized membrane protein YphA (DoxX/SURF4 family)
MKFDQPLGDSALAAFFVRVALGAFLLLSGKAKMNGMPGFVNPDFVIQMQNMKMMPDTVSTIYAILLPYLEILTGGFLVLGFWTTFTAILACAIFGVSVYMWGLFPAETKMMFNKDVILFACSFSLLYSGAGAFSMDRFRRG